MTGHPPQLAAIARAASAVAEAGSLTVTLAVLADAVRSAGSISAAQVVTVRVDADETLGWVTVAVEDDGQGLPARTAGRPHLGITSMTERTQAALVAVREGLTATAGTE